MELISKILKKIYKKKQQQTKVSFFTKNHFSSEKYIIGDYTYGKPTVLFDNAESNLIIGNFCSISQNVTIFLGGNHRVDWISTYPFNVLVKYFPESEKITGHPATNGSVKIGNDVWIGKGVTIMSGITIGNGAVIGAEAVVTKDVGAFEIWAGNPARFIKKRFSDEDILKLQAIEWWNWDIKKIKKSTSILCSNKIERLKNI